MEPQEKWDRMNNPQCLDDYGIVMNTEELMAIPEGRELLDDPPWEDAENIDEHGETLYDRWCRGG